MKFVVALAVLAVLLVLGAGITAMFRGSGTTEDALRSNKLMQLRVATQAVAVLVILLALWFSGQGPS